MPSKKSQLQFYADECFPLTSVTYLKSLGISAIHAYDKKLTKKSDQFHLKAAKSLKRILITIDRDFLYYNQVNFNDHPGVVVISTSSVTPSNINGICKKLLKKITSNYIKDSLIKVSNNKLIKYKNREKVGEMTF